MTGILGPSGSGKSVFLKLITGYVRPSGGHVLMGGYDLGTQAGTARSLFGYVPQAEIMIPDLTARRSLDYRLRLECPLQKSTERSFRITETCRMLGLEANLDDLLKTRIGYPADDHDAHLCGGERRRINIAHELLHQREVLILDEPTSGLSALDADVVTERLSDLARKDGLNIVATLHQPSQKAFERLDDLLVVSWGGRPAFYGKARRAVEYFERFGKVQMRYRDNPAEFVLEYVRSRDMGEVVVRELERQIRERKSDFLRFPIST
jgi:ABC-type multidrug transport system ATPase subunit